MSLEHSPSDPHHVAPRRALASKAAAARSRRLGLTGPRSRLWPILLSTLVCAACPRAAAAQACGSCAPPPGLARAPVGEPTPSPDQSLELDAPAPRRRAASYADLGALLRARVRVGALVAPWASPWAWLRFDVELETELRAPQRVELRAAIQALVVGAGLQGLFVGLGARARLRGGSLVRAEAELGYTFQRQGLLLGAALGVRAALHPRASRSGQSGEAGLERVAGPRRLAPTLRVFLGHAFF